MVGSDPDADRAGVILRTDKGDFIPLTGNQIGCMLISYIIEARKLSGTLPSNACVIKSIVSSPLADAIGKKNGVKLMDVLTGFKFIGEKMTEFEETKEYSYIFGFEESYGYLCGTYARDKDAVSASMLIVEMAAFYAKQGKTLYDVLCGIFEEYGYFIEGVQNASFPGVDGAENMKKLMENLRTNAPTELAGQKVSAVEDYLASERKFTDGKTEEINLPKSNVLCFITECGDKIFVRPSGTEPKVKFYYLVSGDSEKASLDKIDAYKNAVSLLLK
jgi:phosphoglucomutase